MSNHSIHTVLQNNPDFPATLLQIPQPPTQLYISSNNWPDLMQRPKVAIVGSRKVTPYGRQVTSSLASELAKAGVVIVSGLALGVDSIAHRAAVDAGGLTIAILPAGVDPVYPASHHGLARNIYERGGALISEYPSGSTVYKNSFIARNRIVSGISDAVLVTEASLKSGTLHTTRFALEQGKDVLAVPGNITSMASVGTNNLIRSGATPITAASDVFHVLGIQPRSKKRIPTGNTPQEEALITLLLEGSATSESLLEKSGLAVNMFNQALTMLEITGVIHPLGNNQWGLR